MGYKAAAIALRALFFAFFFCLLADRFLQAQQPPAGQEIKVAVTLEKSQLSLGEALQGKIVVEHPKGLAIDEKNVTIEGKLLPIDSKVDHDKGGGIVATTMEFTIKAEKPGLQMLPPISVAVGGRSYSSAAATYSVAGQSDNAMQSSKTAGANGIWLKLENIVKGATTLYPKQKIRVGYRYTFNGSIQLVEENLPLLEGANGLKKIGEPEAKTTLTDTYAIREVTQLIQAEEEGEYQFSPAVVSGYTYTLDGIGNPVFHKPKIEASSAPLTISVKGFPEKPPASFNGAIGDYTFSVELLSPNELTVGDKVTLSLKIGGQGELEDVPMPEVCCQPGFSGNFKPNDIPPIGVVKGHEKYFVVDLRPLNSTIHEIPSIAFSFFNPKDQAFTELKSKPIPIKVFEPDQPYVSALKKYEKVPEPSLKEGSEQKIKGNEPLSQEGVQHSFFSSWQTFFMIPIALFLLWLAWKLMQSQKKLDKREEQAGSSRWLKQARIGGDGSLRHRALEKALIGLLIEKGQLDESFYEKHYDQLPKNKEGPAKVRSFFEKVEKERFHPEGALSDQQEVEEGVKLYKQLGGFIADE